MLTHGTLDYPAYFVNANFELEWWNGLAGQTFLGSDQKLPPEISGRHIFSWLLRSPQLRSAAGLHEFVRFHPANAKPKLTKSTLLSVVSDLSAADLQTLGQLHDEAEPVIWCAPVSSDFNLGVSDEQACWKTLYVAFFGEGTLFSVVPAVGTDYALAIFLSRRDSVIRDVL